MELIESASSWWASGFTIASVYAYAERRVKLGASLGPVAQIGWWGMTILGALWGLVFINVVMFLLHSRTLRREIRYGKP